MSFSNYGICTPGGISGSHKACLLVEIRAIISIVVVFLNTNYVYILFLKPKDQIKKLIIHFMSGALVNMNDSHLNTICIKA